MSVYNGLEFTRNCLHDLRRTVDLSTHEVIIVDDTSTDSTREFLATLGPPFRIILNTTKRSYAANNNAAARLASGDVLCLLNNDLVLTSDWLEPMLAAFDRFPDAGFVGNVQRRPHTGRYDHMGVCLNRQDRGGKHFGADFLFNPFRGYTQWHAVTAACCLVKRSVFLQHGGFDDSYINGYEDTDLCLRLGQSGFTPYVANDSVVFHLLSASPGRKQFEAQNCDRFCQRWQGYLHDTLTWRDDWFYSLGIALSKLQRNPFQRR